MTSRELANYVIQENEPFDYGWIRHIRKTEGFKGLLCIAKETTEEYAENVSKQLIGRAARIVAEEMNNRTW